MKTRDVLDGILQSFENGNIPAIISYSLNPASDKPMLKWSILNQISCYIHGGDDYRGFKQWNRVNRYVKKGEKAQAFILVPCIKKIKDEEKRVLKGFKAAAVFDYSQTDGEELEYHQLESPDFPLIEKAEEWGISVSSIPHDYKFLGAYSGAEIKLATRDECVFFHELTHAADDRAQGGLKAGQDPFQEIVAELGALALCQLVGKSGEKYLGNGYRYIKHYSEKAGISPHVGVMRLLNRTETALNEILGGKNET
jgi:hypothetical protein